MNGKYRLLWSRLKCNFVNLHIEVEPNCSLNYKVLWISKKNKYLALKDYITTIISLNKANTNSMFI